MLPVIVRRELQGEIPTTEAEITAQEYANSVIEAESSRVTPTYEYNCAHSVNPEWTEGLCNWTKKE